MTDANPEGLAHQPLIEHLRELRNRLIRVAWGIFVGSILCYNFVETIFAYIRRPIEKYLPSQGLVFTAPSDKFMAYLKVAILGGTILTLPWTLYQIWKFVAPALYSKERKYALGFVSAGFILFLVGVLFCYFLAMPAAFEFLMTFGGEVDKPMITIDSYLGFFVTMLFVFGVTFELPLIIVILGMLGIVTPQFLREKRRIMVVVIAVAAAVLTPTPDAPTMLILMVPMYLLYEISILVVGAFTPRT